MRAAVNRSLRGILAGLGVILLVSSSSALRPAHAGGSGSVGFTSAEKRVAFNADDFAVNVDAKNIVTLANCYADPTVIASGAGASVSFGGSTLTDSSKNFTTNALASKPVNVTGQTLNSGQQTAFTLTGVTDPSGGWTPGALVGLQVSAENIIGGRLSPTILISTVTYTANTLTDSSHNLIANQLAGLTVVSGASSGTIASNTATVITLTANWTGGTPSNANGGQLYAVITPQVSGTIAENTATTITVAGTWTPETPLQNTRLTIPVPAATLSGSGGSVTYTRPEAGDGGTYTATTLADASKAWVTNEFAGVVVTASGNSAVVASNSATTLTLSSPWTPATPVNGSSYAIQGSVNDTSKSLTANQLAGLSVATIEPAISGAAGPATYLSLTGTGATVTYGANSLTNTAASFPTSIVGERVVVGEVSGVIQSRPSPTQVVLTAPWSVQPVNGSTYTIANMKDSTKSFTPNALAGRTIVSGSNAAVVFSNTATVVVLKTPWSPATPAAGAAYTITPRTDTGAVASNTATRIMLSSGWTPVTPAAGSLYRVFITTTGATVQSNTATVVTMTAPWAPAVPTAGSTYSIANSQPTSPCGVGSFSTTITFDASKLQYLSTDVSGWLTSTGRPLFVSPCVPTTGVGTVTVACSTTGGTPLGPSGNGTMFTITFKPLGAVNTSTSVVQATTIADIQGDQITHTDTSLTVYFSRCADVSGDGAVSLTDTAQVLANFGRTSDDPDWLSNGVHYDLNSDGAISLVDAAYALDQFGQACVYT